jgi:hydrogenase expression/formation protein HypD
MNEVFEETDAECRGLGVIRGSGLSIREKFVGHDASRLLEGLSLPTSSEPPGCLCGDVLRGTRAPTDCPLFRARCTPLTPVGACMVSGEGTCAAYYKYRANPA